MLLRRFGLKTGVLFAYFGLESGMVFFRELRHLLECMKVFIVSKKERNMRIRNGFDEFFCLQGRGVRLYVFATVVWPQSSFPENLGRKRAFPFTFSPTECGILKTRPSIMNSDNSFYTYLFVSHEFFLLAENRKNKRYWSELSKISWWQTLP